MEKKNINDYLNDDVCIGLVENVDTQKIMVSVEKEAILNSLKINDIVILSGSNADEKLIGILTKVSKKRVEVSEELDGSEDVLYRGL